MNRKIAALVIPNIISNITVPLLGVVDSAIAGRLADGAQAIGAISIGATIFNLIYWNCAFLRMGSSGLTAQALGARKLDECGNILVRSVIVALLLSFLLLLLQRPISQLSFSLMFGSDAVESMAMRYYNVRIWAAPATVSLYALYGWFIGMQNSKTPMVCSFLLNIVNIVAGILFVFHFEMDIEGIAGATVAAQYSGLLFMITALVTNYSKVLKVVKWREILRIAPLLEFFNLNKDIFLRNASLIVVYTLFTSASSSMGDTTLALNALLMHLFTLYSFMSDGIANAAESLVGRYIGARNIISLRKSIKLLSIWCLMFSLIFVVIYTFGWELILNLFTDSESIIAMARDYIWWLILIPLFGCAPFLLDGILIGATDSKTMRNAMFLSTTTFLAIYFSTRTGLGNSAIWLSFSLFLLVRGVYILLLTRGLKSVYKKIKS